MEPLDSSRNLKSNFETLGTGPSVKKIQPERPQKASDALNRTLAKNSFRRMIREKDRSHPPLQQQERVVSQKAQPLPKNGTTRTHIAKSPFVERQKSPRADALDKIVQGMSVNSQFKYARKKKTDKHGGFLQQKLIGIKAGGSSMHEAVPSL